MFAQDSAALADIVGPAQAQALQLVPEGFDEQLQRTLEWLGAEPATRDVVTLGDTAYPADLLNIEDPPLMLYRMGALEIPGMPALAMVGSRNPTPRARTTPGSSRARWRRPCHHRLRHGTWH